MAPSPPSRFSGYRAASLTAVYVLMGLHIAHGRLAGRTLAPLEFSEALFTIHRGLVTAGAIFLVVAMAATVMVGRFFCSWGCHILALEDACVWLLAKAGVRPKPIRSRVLVWMPLALALYLFFWPQASRFLRGESWPGLHVEPAGFGSFATSDVLRQMPGPWLALATFLVCGFVVVWVLGSRSFCSTVCPYGALFRGAERLAPGRIILSGGCTGCGKCTANCLSGVLVQQEVVKFGAVVDSQCIRCLDCVGRCPEKALTFGFTTPPLFRGIITPLRAKLPAAFSWRAEAALALLALAAFLALRDLYDVMPILLSAGLAVLCAATWTRSVTSPSARRAAASLLLAVAVLHCAFIRYHAARGEALIYRPARRAEALAHLQRAHDWGLLRPVSLERRLAALKLQSGLAAEPHLRLVLAAEPDDLETLILLGRLAARSGRGEEASGLLARALAVDARRAGPPDAKVSLGLGTLLADVGRYPEAAARFRSALEADPTSAAARHDLEVVLARFSEGRPAGRGRRGRT